MEYAHIVEPGKSIALKDFNPSEHGGLEEAEARALATVKHDQIERLQEILYAAGTHGLIIVLQGPDTSGKDGTIRKLSTCLNVQHTSVASFKQPTDLEKSHDFLWRVHQVAPAKGQIKIFNRSHYEDVLVTRVHGLIDKDVWKSRYGRINDFEELLRKEANTIVVKFFLHISKKEQEQRLLDREAEVEKSWKLSVGDWKERELWDDYQQAYADVLSKCSTKHAPWYIVPADHKWYRDLVIAEALVETLKPYKDKWDAVLKERGEIAKKELAAFRQTKKRKA